MLGLPKTTETAKQLPKKAIYAKFNMNSAQKERFDSDISRITIVNEVNPTTARIKVGENIKGFYVLSVLLKSKDFDEKTIIQLSKLIPQNILFALVHEDECKLAVYHSKLMQSEWKPLDEQKVELSGTTLDMVWDNIIVQIGEVKIEEGHSLEEQIALDEERKKLQKEIDRLEAQARKEKQPKKKFELADGRAWNNASCDQERIFHSQSSALKGRNTHSFRRYCKSIIRPCSLCNGHI